MVLPKREIVPDIVTAGLDTVAVRLSAHRVFAEIVGELDEPLAAPSANRFGRVSPTTAQHVLDELDGRIPLIVDAGPTEHGIESTIVAVRDGRIAVLRRGPITHEQLSEFAEVSSVVATPKISSPGQLPSHYAPKTPLRLIDNAEAFLSAEESARWIAGVACKEGRSPARPAADWRPPLLEIRRGAKPERTARFARSCGQSFSSSARARCTRSRSHRCGTSSVSGTRRGDNGST